MAYKNRLLAKLDLPPKREPIDDSVMAEIMTHPGYVEQSSALIHDALQKGFDVLQMGNGDIVATGTKTVTYRFKWNPEEKRLKRAAGMEEASAEAMEDLQLEPLE